MAFALVNSGMSFENILKKLEEQVDQTTAILLVDDLNHLVKRWSFVEWFGDFKSLSIRAYFEF